MEAGGAGKNTVMSNPQPRTEASDEPEVEPVAGDGVTQEAVDAATPHGADLQAGAIV